MSDIKNVVVLGLGQSGISVVRSLAKSLPASHRIIVIHQHSFSFYPIASLRAQTVPGWEKKAAAPISQLFSPKSRHIVLQNTKVVQLNDHSVLVDTPSEKHGLGTEITFDYAVIATGASYAPATQVPEGTTSLEALEKVLSGVQSDIASSSSILVIGAGATGIEAAAEFKEAHPSKTVTLVGAGSSFMPLLNPAFSTKVHKKLTEMGIKVHLGSEFDATNLSTGKIEKTTFNVSGHDVEADYVFIAFGYQANTSFITNPALLTPKGLVRVKPTFQLETLDHVFAVGDASSVDEIKLAYNAKNHGDIAAANILSLIAGKSAAKVYKPAPPAGFVTLGSKAGAGQLFGWGLPSWFVTKMKSAGLRADVWQSEFVTI